MNRKIAKFGLFYPTRLITGQNIYHYMHFVDDFEKLKREDMETFQWKRLKRSLDYYFKHVPYYSNLRQSNKIKIERITAKEDMLELPYLTKDIVQKKSKLFFNPSIKKQYRRTTSGSQGTPLTFYKDRKTMACMDAVMYQAYKWHGINVGEPQARFWGTPLTFQGKVEATLKDFLMNRKRLSAFELNLERFEKYYDTLKKFRPCYFYGYPSLIHEFALFIKEQKKDLSFLKLKGVIGTGELILHRHKKEIEDIFNCRFFLEYGCTETVVIGFECVKGNIHLMAHNVFLEVIKNGEQVYDEEGEIHVTELNTFTFPFVRYKVGDTGMISRSLYECDSCLPVMKITKGRTDSYVITSSGHKVYDAVFAYVLKKGIDSFKAKQTGLDSIDLYLRVNDEFSQNLQNYYIDKLKEKIDAGMNFSVKIVKNLPREKSGKMRYFVPYKGNYNYHLRFGHEF